MKTVAGFAFEMALPDTGEPEESGISLEERAAQLIRILIELERCAPRISEEQFCGLVHEAARSCGFEDAVDAWASMLKMTEQRFASVDLSQLNAHAPSSEIN